MLAKSTVFTIFSNIYFLFICLANFYFASLNMYFFFSLVFVFFSHISTNSGRERSLPPVPVKTNIIIKTNIKIKNKQNNKKQTYSVKSKKWCSTGVINRHFRSKTDVFRHFRTKRDVFRHIQTFSDNKNRHFQTTKTDIFRQKKFWTHAERACHLFQRLNREPNFRNTCTFPQTIFSQRSLDT